MLRVMGESTSTHPKACACGEPRSTADPELIEAMLGGGGKGFMELNPPRPAAVMALGPTRARFLRACVCCGAVYFPSS